MKHTYLCRALLFVSAGNLTLCSSILSQAAEDPAAADATEAPHHLSPLQVVARQDEQSFRWVVDPKAPAQPIPSQDGADLLRAVPGFNVIRKGGTDGDPVLRGMAGSRIGILLDGEHIFGGCGNRMDPPTAYAFPAAYDRVTVIKGPQSVMHGPGTSAGVVLFERTPEPACGRPFSAEANFTYGSFDRNDQFLQLKAIGEALSLELIGTRSAANDYEDGAGRRIHSAYERWSSHMIAAWTPTPASRLEVSAILSDGEAAYADRAMDGTVFDRRNAGLRFSHEPSAEWIDRFSASAYYNYVDHVMDNFSLRAFTPTSMMPNPTVSNPDRETYGARLAAEGKLASASAWQLGVDAHRNVHSLRRTMNEPMMPYRAMARSRDAAFTSTGIFGELAHPLSERGTLIAGLRVDLWEATDERALLRVPMAGMQANPTAGQRRSSALPAGFVRYEHLLRKQLSLMAGIGHSSRFPDYWELFNKESAASLSAFATDPEPVTQIDLGASYRGQWFSATLTGFANRTDDFILIESMVPKGMRTATIVRNIDARSFGAEATAHLKLSTHWSSDVALAYVRGDNRTDDQPLAQQPPLEGRIALSYASARAAYGVLLRAVDGQDRVAPNQGNIAGQDIGESSGFATVSVHGSFLLPNGWRLSAGIDNLLDRAYAEHLNASAAQIPGLPPPSVRVNEPGRTAWVTLQAAF